MIICLPRNNLRKDKTNLSYSADLNCQIVNQNTLNKTWKSKENLNICTFFLNWILDKGGKPQFVCKMQQTITTGMFH